MVTERRAKEIFWEEQTRFGLRSWRFEVRDIPQIGMCYFGPKLIVLARELCEFNDEDEVRETIRHEVAHVISNDATHGPRWQAACDRVGCRPEACGYPRGPETRWAFSCLPCGYLGHAVDRPDWEFPCPRCGSGCEFRET